MSRASADGGNPPQWLARERFIWRFRLAAVCFATVQTVIETGDDAALGWVYIGLFWMSVVGAGLALRGDVDDERVRRVGVVTMACDVAIVGLIMANNITDPSEPVYLIGILAQLEATIRWHRRGGAIAGVVAGSAAGVWTLVVTSRATGMAEYGYATMRAGIIIGLGVFLGSLVRRLSEQHDLMEGILDASRDLIVVLDDDGIIRSANAASLDILGYRPDELVGQHYERLLPFDARPADPAVNLGSPGDPPTLLQRSVLCKDGSIRWLELNVAHATDASALHVTARDVTERREVQRGIAESEQRFRSLFEHNTDAVYAFDLTGRFTSVNPATEALTGYRIDELTSMSFSRLIAPEHLERSREHFRRAVAGESQDYQTVAIASDGRRIDLEVTNTPIVVDAEIVGVFGVAKDVTERRRLERELSHQATHDALTGLPNRAHLEAAIDVAVRAVSPAGLTSATTVGLTLLFIDLDRFKLVNDSLGHRSGDEVLVAAVRRLRRHVRADDLLARWAGDEFCVLLAEATSQTTAMAIAERLRSVLAEPFAVAGREVQLSASIGIASCDGNGGERLVQIADHAMYEAKRAGRDRVSVYDETTSMLGPTQIDLEAELRRAIEQRELVVHFQPIVELGSGRIVALESLVRWPQPDGTMRLPAAFVPIAEECGLIGALTRLVLAESCQQLARWDVDPEIATRPQSWINVSVSDLESAEFAAQVMASIAGAGITPDRVVLEVTETMLMRDVEQVGRTVESLRLAGVSLAVDDFGTGYSSMSQLHRLEVAACKIDRCFVSSAPESERDAAILSALIDVGAAFGIPVVAEGVEEVEELHAVQASGGSLVQGYLLAEPTSAAEIAPLLRAGAVAMPDRHAPASSSSAVGA